MSILQGIVYQSGVIEFLESENEWAFKAIRAGMKSQDGRVVLDPSKAPIQLRISDKSEKASVPWLDRIQLLISTADRVYLRPVDKTIRFQQANYEITDSMTLITLGSQLDVDEYAGKYWNRIKYFFAFRYDAFRFDVKRMVTQRIGTTESTRRMELVTRQYASDVEDVSHIVIDATGSGAPVDIIDWRGTVEEGETGRFARPEVHCELAISQIKRPLTFVHEYREEFKSHSYEFEGEQLAMAMKRIQKRVVDLAKEQADERQAGKSEDPEQQDQSI